MRPSPRKNVFTVLGAVLVLALLAAGCFGPPPEPPKEPKAPPRPKGWSVLDPAEARSLVQRLSPANQGLGSWMELAPTLDACLGWLERRPGGGRVRDPRLSREAMARSLETLLSLLPRLDAEPQLLVERFDWLTHNPDATVTGYHLPTIEASLTPDPAYPHPIYGLPPDLKVLDLGAFHSRWEGQRLIYRIENDEAVPYPDREAIDFEGALRGKGLEIAWAKSLVDVNHLQTQGSGELLLPDGTRELCTYAGKNGRAFKGLGAVFLERDLLPGQHLSRESMAGFLDKRPQLWRDVFAENKSYVFFQLKDGPATGAMGTPLADRISLAVDREMIPLGAPVLLLADFPRTAEEEALASLPGVRAPVVDAGGAAISGEMGEMGGTGGVENPRAVERARERLELHLAQDTGGAIKGARIDYFWGKDDTAEELAMRTKLDARVFIPLVKDRP